MLSSVKKYTMGSMTCHHGRNAEIENREGARNPESTEKITDYGGEKLDKTGQKRNACVRETGVLGNSLSDALISAQGNAGVKTLRKPATGLKLYGRMGKGFLRTVKTLRKPATGLKLVR